MYTSTCLTPTERDFLYDEIAQHPLIITLCKSVFGCGKRQNTPNYVDFEISPASVADDVAASLEASNSSNPNINIVSTSVTDPPGSGGGGKSIPFWVWIIIAVGAVLIIGAVVGLVVYLKFIRPRGRSDMWNSARAMWGTKSGDDSAQGGLRTQTDHDVYNNI